MHRDHLVPACRLNQLQMVRNPGSSKTRAYTHTESGSKQKVGTASKDLLISHTTASHGMILSHPRHMRYLRCVSRGYAENRSRGLHGITRNQAGSRVVTRKLSRCLCQQIHTGSHTTTWNHSINICIRHMGHINPYPCSLHGYFFDCLLNGLECWRPEHGVRYQRQSRSAFFSDSHKR